MKNASTITAFIISFLVVGSLALVFLFLDNKEEEPAAAEPAAQTEVPARQTVTPQPTVDPLTKEDISRQTATPPSLINLSSPQTLAQAIAKVIQDRDEDILKSLEIQQAVTENQSRLIREPAIYAFPLPASPASARTTRGPIPQPDTRSISAAARAATWI